MAAPKGNQFYKLAKINVGKPKRFKTPDELWKAAEAYFKSIDNNPYIIYMYIGKKKVPKETKPKPYTMQGFAIYCGMTTQGLRYYRDLPEDDPQQKDFLAIYSMIEEVIYDQKFSGAAIGMFHHQIIARSIGLIEKLDVTSEGKPVKSEWHIHPVKASNES